MKAESKKRTHKDKLILVTGGAGYKGSTLCRELLFRGYTVRVLDSLRHRDRERSLAAFFNYPNFEFIKGDITNSKDVKRALESISDIIHLAAIVGDKPCERDPKTAIEVNYKGTQLLADMAKRQGISRFLFASTCSNYGITDPRRPATEEDELNPLSLYAETKVDCEKYLIDIGKNSSFSPTILRFSTGFGISGRTRFDLTVNSFTYEALQNKKLLVFAEEAWRPFTHVRDMARIYCTILSMPKGATSNRILNAGWNGQNYMKKDIVRMIKEVIGYFEVDYINTIDDRRSYHVDFTKIESILNLSPTRSVKDGIEEVATALRTKILNEDDYEMNRLK